MNKFQKEASKLALRDIKTYNLDIKLYRFLRNSYLNGFKIPKWSFEIVKDFAKYCADRDTRIKNKNEK